VADLKGGEMIKALAIAAVAALGIFAPATGNASVTHHNMSATHAEPAVCGPVVALVEYWLPITDRATPHPRIIKHYPGGATTYAQPGYPWAGASATIYDVAQYATGNLRTSAVMAADAMHALGALPDPSTWRPVLRAALTGIRSACPSLPASVVNGPLPK
jgi:hypothetical protein